MVQCGSSHHAWIKELGINGEDRGKDVTFWGDRFLAPLGTQFGGPLAHFAVTILGQISVITLMTRFWAFLMIYY